jgi:hypothetical protein
MAPLHPCLTGGSSPIGDPPGHPYAHARPRYAGVMSPLVATDAIIGVCTALFLAEKGRAVALREKGRVGGELSSRNWDWCRTMGRDEGEIPLALESLRLWRDIGDCLTRWINDVDVSTPHRLVSPVWERYSATFFADANAGTLVSAISTCLSDGQAPRYEPITDSVYLAKRLNATYDHRKATSLA